MKKAIWIILISIQGFYAWSQGGANNSSRGNANEHARRQETDTARQQMADATVSQETIKAIDKKKGNDKENWSSFLSSFANIAGTSGNSLTFNPTLWELWHIGTNPNNPKDPLAYYKRYNTQVFLRNFQITSFLTPDNKNQLTVDSGGLGFKYAIINNTAARLKDYMAADDLLTKIDTVDKWLLKHMDSTHNYKAYDTYLLSNYDEKNIPEALLKELKAQFHIKGKVVDELNVQKFIADRLARKPLLTFAFNHSYDFHKQRTSNLAVATEFTFSPFSVPNGPVFFDLNISYQWQADSAEKFANYDRKLFSVAFGKNIAFCKWFELKPSVTYVNTEGPLYAKESKESFNASLTPRFKINSQFWLPITFKYTPHNGQIFGYVSIQYSLK